MPVTFLDVVNASLKRVRVIAGDDGELATSTVTSTATGAVATGAFTDSGRQVQIDLMIQVWQEAVNELYSEDLLPQEASTATIAFVDGTREYSMPSDFERIAGDTIDQRVFRGATTGLVIREYPGGYAQMLADQPVATDYRGTPARYAISPSSGDIRFDAEPTSEEDGDTYNVLYEKRLALTSTMATETLPFSDTVSDRLVPVAAETWNRIQKKEFDGEAFRNGLARAAAGARKTQPRRIYGIRRL